MKKRATLGIAISLGVLVLLLCGSEFAFRALEGQDTRVLVDNLRDYLLTGMMREFEPRAYTVFQRPRNAPGCNSLGYHDGKWKQARVPGVPRILCMGGSTTESGNSRGTKGAYPWLLERILEERTGRDFEVMNAGISGWTTAEMVSAWFLTLKDFDPDVLVLHEGVNDVEPRFVASFEPDYSHWRHSIQIRPVTGIERLLVQCSSLYVYGQLHDGPPMTIVSVSSDLNGPKDPLFAEGRLSHSTSFTFRRNIRSIAHDARADGRLVVLMTMPGSKNKMPGEIWRFGIEENNQHLREVADEDDFLLADAAEVFRARPELEAEFSDGVHLSPAGNQVKAELLADTLSGWVASLPTDEVRPPEDPLAKKRRR